jgi:hypothetical protein
MTVWSKNTMRHYIPSIQHKEFRILIYILIISMLIDISFSSASEIGEYSPFFNTIFGIVILISFIIIDITAAFFLLKYAKSGINIIRGNKLNLIKLHKTAVFTEFTIATIVLFMIFQVVFLSTYFTPTLALTDIITTSFGIFFSSILAYYFVKWYGSSHNFTLLIFCLAFSANSLFLLFTIIADLGDFSVKDLQISINNGKNFTQSNKSEFHDFILNWSDTLDVIRFFLFWYGTATLFAFRSTTIGKRKYWLIISLPLIFYLSYFQAYHSFSPEHLLADLFYLHGSVFATNVITLVFYLAIRKFTVNNITLKNFESIFIIGFVINSIGVYGALYQTMYPPFGLMSYSLYGLSYYLIFIGLYSTTAFISNDTKLRRQLYEYANQTRFLTDIGKAQMIDVIQSEVTSIINNNLETLEEQSGLNLSMSHEEIKGYTKVVLEHVRESKLRQTGDRPSKKDA